MLYERHFAVNLCKFGLTVSAEVFIAEALHDLEVAVKTRHHQQLLQRLRTLRKRVKLTGVHARGHDKVACTLGGRTYEHGSLHLHKPEAVEEVAHGDAKLVAQFKIATHAVATQVKVAILHADVVATVRIIFNREGGRCRSVEHVERINDNFNSARGDIVVFREALVYRTRYLNHIFAPQLIGACAKFSICFFVKHELRNAVAVAKVDKRHTAHFAQSLHPTRKGYHLTCILNAEFTAIVRSVHSLYNLCEFIIF